MIELRVLALKGPLHARAEEAVDRLQTSPLGQFQAQSLCHTESQRQLTNRALPSRRHRLRTIMNRTLAAQDGTTQAHNQREQVNLAPGSGQSPLPSYDELVE